VYMRVVVMILVARGWRLAYADPSVGRCVSM